MRLLQLLHHLHDGLLAALHDLLHHALPCSHALLSHSTTMTGANCVANTRRLQNIPLNLLTVHHLLCATAFQKSSSCRMSPERIPYYSFPELPTFPRYCIAEWLVAPQSIPAMRARWPHSHPASMKTIVRLPYWLETLAWWEYSPLIGSQGE